MAIVTKDADIAALRTSGRIAARALIAASHAVRPGITTAALNDTAEKIILAAGAKPAFLNYQGYPASLCVSVNEEIVHGIPGEREIESGDVVSLDIGVNYQGWFTDHALTVAVGPVDKEISQLIEHTKQSLSQGIKTVKAGSRVGDIGAAVEKFLAPFGYGIIRELCGHGVGRAVHEPPQIPNFGRPHTGPILTEGQIIAIEPMVNLGSGRVFTREDGWTVVSADNAIAAHFEHTVIVTKNGAEIITCP